MRTPSRTPLLCLALLVLLCTCDRAQPTDATPDRGSARPNILVINCEDISPLLPMFGDSTVATPNLSRLAARGIRFPNTFSTAGVCAPSRMTLATGLHPISVGGHHMRTQWNVPMLNALGLEPYGALLPPEAKMVSQLLREHGYYATNNQKTDYQFVAPKTAWDASGPKAHWSGRPHDTVPFFAVYDLEITHESQVWMTGRGNLRFAPGFTDPATPVFGWNDVLPDGERPPLTVPADAALTVPPYLVDDAATRGDLRRVYSNIEIMDRQVGFLLDQLAADGLADNTIVFFFSDHGGPLPRGKRLLYDSGLRVPHIVAFPDGRGAGTVDSALVSFVDFPPTWLRLAGAAVPDWMQGRPFLPRREATPRDYVFAAADRLDGFYDRIRAARDHRFKYLRNYYPERPYYLPVAYREQLPSMQSLLRGRDAGTLTDAQAQWFRDSKPAEELFDTYADPYELNDLASDPAHAAKLAELRAATDAWLNRVGDLGAEDEVAMVSRFWGGADEMPQTGRPQLRRDSLGRFVLESKTPGAQIAYQITPPGEPAGVWRVYTGPFEYRRGDTLRTVAQRIGYRESTVSVGY